MQLNSGKVVCASVLGLLCFALPHSLDAQARSQIEANALCSSGGGGLLVKKPQVSYAQISALHQLRAQNQSRIAIGMSREDLLEILGPPDEASGIWLDSAQTFCIWTYNRIPESDAKGAVHYRSLEVISDLNHRVGGFRFREELSLKPVILRDEVK
jgi:hypothetical protein